MNAYANWIKDFNDFELTRYQLMSVGYGTDSGYTHPSATLHCSASDGLAGQMVVGGDLVFYQPAVGTQPAVRWMLLMSGGRESLSAAFDQCDRAVLLRPGPGKGALVQGRFGLGHVRQARGHHRHQAGFFHFVPGDEVRRPPKSPQQHQGRRP